MRSSIMRQPIHALPNTPQDIVMKMVDSMPAETMENLHFTRLVPENRVREGTNCHSVLHTAITQTFRREAAATSPVQLLSG